jgi:hypothetical protein
LIPTIARIIRGTLSPRSTARKTPSLKDIQVIRNALLQSVEDCDSAPAQRLRHKIAATQTAKELWMLRNDAYQLISQQHSQSAASARINDLISAFEGWLETSQLVRIK